MDLWYTSYKQWSEPKQSDGRKGVYGDEQNRRIIFATTKLNDMMHKKDDDQKTTVLWILAIIGAVATVAAISICSILFLYSGLSGRL